MLRSILVSEFWLANTAFSGLGSKETVRRSNVMSKVRLWVLEAAGRSI